MLRSMDSLKGYTVVAIDGEVGEVGDFLFDDQEWIIRYLVVETGSWFLGEEKLLAPIALKKPQWEHETFPVNLNRSQVKDSPNIASDQPVSRQGEMKLFEHYGWEPYWAPAQIAPSPAAVPPSTFEQAESPEVKSGNPNLRSMDEVRGYSASAADGEVGEVSDLICQDDEWLVRYIVIDTGDWLSDREIIISPDWINRISWSERSVLIELNRSQIENSPAYDPSQPVGRRYETRLYDYYELPVYWEESE